MIVTPAEMRAIERRVFDQGVSAETLMEKVGCRLAAGLVDLIGRDPAIVIFYAGNGNNAGDAFVAARELQRLLTGRHADVSFYLRLASKDASVLGDLAKRKFEQISGSTSRLENLADLPPSSDKLFVVDGLLGIGSKGALREPIKAAAREINHLRRCRGAYVFSIDPPSGLNAETGEADPDAVVADETAAVGFAAAGLVADSAVNHVGKLRVISLSEFNHAPNASSNPGEVIVAADLNPLLPPRPHESNKGMYGRIGLIAGSVGATGAAVMCAHACARAGAGLITLLTHPDIYGIVAGAASPEVMVKPLPSLLDALEMPFDVLGLGPGLGRERGDDVRVLIERWPKPLVIDADGLNLLAEDLSALTRAKGERLLTPHPGEMKRLLHGSPELKSLAEDGRASRTKVATAFTSLYPTTLLLKGARTIVAARGEPVAYNTTGNAGMATGGMGDVLTGICCALAGQHLSLYDAARYAAFVHGEAADLAREDGQSEQSLLPLDLMEHLGRAFTCIARAGQLT